MLELEEFDPIFYFGCTLGEANPRSIHRQKGFQPRVRFWELHLDLESRLCHLTICELPIKYLVTLHFTCSPTTSQFEQIQVWQIGLQTCLCRIIKFMRRILVSFKRTQIVVNCSHCWNLFGFTQGKKEWGIPHSTLGFPKSTNSEKILTCKS